MKTYVTLDEALALVDEYRPVLPVETVTLMEAADRVAAEDVYATLNLPPFRRSPFDGYAFHACDIDAACEAQPVTLPILR